MKSNIFSTLNQTSSITDVGVDIGELFLDAGITDELLRSLPGIKLVMAGIDVKNAISYHFWIKKFYGFISALENFNPEEREKILNKADENSEILLDVLDRVESDYKPYMLGKVFSQYASQKITKDDFLRINHVLNKSYSGDLLSLIEFKNKYVDINLYVGKRLPDDDVILFPMIEQFIDVGSATYNGYTPPKSRELTELGAKFIKCFN